MHTEESTITESQLAAFLSLARMVHAPGTHPYVRIFILNTLAAMRGGEALRDRGYTAIPQVCISRTRDDILALIDYLNECDHPSLHSYFVDKLVKYWDSTVTATIRIPMDDDAKKEKFREWYNSEQFTHWDDVYRWLTVHVEGVFLRQHGFGRNYEFLVHKDDVEKLVALTEKTGLQLSIH